MRADQHFDFPSEDAPVGVPLMVLPAVAQESEIETKVPALVDQAAALTIRDQESLAIANDFSIAIKRMRKEIDEAFDPIIEAAHVAHKVALDKKRKYIEPVDAAEKTVKGKLGAYLAEQERIRKEAERKAWEVEQEKIRAKQEAERKAREAEEKATAERRRIEEEAKKKAREADEKAARARSEEGRRKAQEEADRIRREAAERDRIAKANADAEQARLREEAAKREAELSAKAPAVIAKIETKGISTRQDWDFEVIDENAVPREFLAVDETKLRKYAKAMKGTASVAGVRFFPKSIVSQRIA
ncbi:MAG: hypothetical protein WC329_07675 [Candidatus Omnitrophota bacterium]|jgi:phage-related minor tail protein